MPTHEHIVGVGLKKVPQGKRVLIFDAMLMKIRYEWVGGEEVEVVEWVKPVPRARYIFLGKDSKKDYHKVCKH